MWSFNKIRTPLMAAALAGPLLAAPVQFRTRELPRAVIGNFYHGVVATQVDGRCPIGDVLLELAGGNLPRGIELSGDALAGIPKEFGIFRFRLRAANRCASAVEDFAFEVTGKPILRVVPEELVFECREGDAQTKEQTVQVAGTWPDLPYLIRAANAPWLRFHASQGATPYEGSPYMGDAVTVQATAEGLAPGTYHGVLSFSVDMGANVPQIPVTLRVLPK